MADECCDSNDHCSTPALLRLPVRPAPTVAPPSGQWVAGASCCAGGVPVFDGVDPRYKLVLWTVIGINGAMFLTEMIAGHLAGSQALKADALDFLAFANADGGQIVCGMTETIASLRAFAEP